MNVKELREKLEALPDDAPLFVRGYEGGVNDLTDIDPVKVELNANSEWYYGNHEPVDEYRSTQPEGPTAEGFRLT